MQQRFSSGSGGQADVDKRTGVIYVKSGYGKGERANRPGGAGSQPVGPRAGVRVAGSVSVLAGQ